MLGLEVASQGAEGEKVEGESKTFRSDPSRVSVASIGIKVLLKILLGME